MEGLDVQNLITNVVFPIAAYVLLFWFFREQTIATREQIDKMNQEHKEETNGLKEAINNNTLTMQKLIDKMDTGK